MQTSANPNGASRSPWKKGKLIGQKPPLKLAEIWTVRTRLQMSGKTRNLALFNLAIDSKLRGCNLVVLLVLDVAHGGHVLACKTRLRLLAWMRRPATVCNIARCFAGLCDTHLGD